jgi:hypothetical protein
VTLVATRSFTDPSDGQPITAGRTYVAESADVARLFPENFKPASGRKSGPIIRDGGTATLVDSRKRPAPTVDSSLEVPELRADATSKLTVKLGSGALREIQRELGRASNTMLEVIETGGSLFAGQTRLGVLELVDACGPGEFEGEARRMPDAVRISARHAHEIARELRSIWQDENLGVIGGWHTHPRAVAEPSDQDRISALLAYDALREDRGWRAPSEWLDLILYPDARDGWEGPRVAGWATRRLEWSDKAVTEPVKVEA